MNTLFKGNKRLSSAGWVNYTDLASFVEHREEALQADALCSNRAIAIACPSPLPDKIDILSGHVHDSTNFVQKFIIASRKFQYQKQNLLSNKRGIYRHSKKTLAI